MAEIIKVYREKMPAVRLVGKKYGDKDRDSAGSFGTQWGLWFQNGWFSVLEKLGAAPEGGDAYLGAMRLGPDGFEYWVGMAMPAGAETPEGYQSADIPAGEVGVCWIQGREDSGELYGCHDACVKALGEKG